MLVNQANQEKQSFPRINTQEEKMSMRKVYDPVHDSAQHSEDEVPTPQKTQRTESGSSNPLVRARKFSITSIMNNESNDSNETPAPAVFDMDHPSTPVKNTETPAPLLSVKREPSRYQRHIKKVDGNPFTRSDIQYGFMLDLFKNDYCVFTNIFKRDGFQFDCSKNLKLPVTNEEDITPEEKISTEGKTLNHFVGDTTAEHRFDARTWIDNDYLTFGQLYLLTISSSTKCSKILRDKLLTDTHIAFSMCVLSFLVNIGRLNTTNNFYVEMTSQSRTFHTIPVLQYGIVPQSRQLQDTPRIKSILKNIPLENEFFTLEEFYNDPETNHFNIITLLFAICEAPSLISTKYLLPYIDLEGNAEKTTETEEEPKAEQSQAENDEEKEDDNEKVYNMIFDILDKGDYNFAQRSDILVWLVYIHLETNMSEDAITESLSKFSELSSNFNKKSKKFKLTLAENVVDRDTEEEFEFSKSQNILRQKFLEKYNNQKHTSHTNVYEIPTDQTDSTSIVGDKSNSLVNEDIDESVVNTSPEATPVKAVARETRQKRKTVSETPTSVTSSPNEGSRRKKRRSAAVKSESSTDSNLSERITIINTSHSSMEKSKNEPLVKTTRFEKNVLAMIKTEEDRKLDIEKMGGNIESLTQKDFKEKLYEAQSAAQLKRNELGYLKIFNEYEDIPMATVLGIRGKKKKKYQDTILGFETDLLRVFKIGKQKLLDKLAKDLPKN